MEIADNELDGFLPDLVVGPEADPLWDGTVLLGLLGQLGLDPERLLRRLRETKTHRESVFCESKIKKTYLPFPCLRYALNLTCLKLQRVSLHLGIRHSEAQHRDLCTQLFARRCAGWF